MTEADVPWVAVYARSNSFSMGMAAVPRKLCRRPSVCPTSCITSSFSAWPMYSRGTGPPGAIAPLAASVAIAPGGPVPREYIGQALKELVMHEVGHTLGLRHNFRGTAAIPMEDRKSVA